MAGLDGLLSVDATTGLSTLHPRTAAGGWASPIQPTGTPYTPQPYDMTNIVTGEFNDVLANSTSGKQMLLYKGTTAGNGFSGPFTNAAGFDCCTQLTMGKFDNDDYPDLLAVDNTGKLRLYAGTAAGTTWAASTDAGPGGDWRDHSELAQITMSPNGHSGLLAKDGTGAMLSYPSGDNGSVDWTHPTAFGPRD